MKKLILYYKKTDFLKSREALDKSSMPLLFTSDYSLRRFDWVFSFYSTAITAFEVRFASF